MKRTHDDDDDDGEAPPMAPPSRRKVQFTQQSDAYTITTFKEIIGPSLMYDIQSSLRVPSLDNKAASYIQADFRPSMNLLFIEYFVRPYLTGHGVGRYSQAEVESMSEMSARDKHGSTHLCAMLRKLMAEGIINMQTHVQLEPVATVRTVGVPSQSRLVQYYESLSFSYDFDEDMEGMTTTVARILAKCDEGMQRVRFT